MAKDIALAEMKNLVGTEMGVSDWITVDQSMINAFAKATLDDQFIHTDPERAKAESPFGGTIAHGFLTLSLLSALNYDALPRIRETTMGINYGFDAVRFVAPVKSGARVRGRFTLAEARFRGAAMLVTTYDVTVEIENEKKPALTARWITISQFNPEDRPEDA
ncbi:MULTISPECIES: MaoC family dehydratase [Rhizobium/Agrobacterium group]|jgi:acyl dehydratase|uniref:Nodulation protein N n=1 Tax=Agrobacterium arsenijevicii TaxID=1585697 RepID=A0ABR5DDP3_9HYPH|nr:MULTISPECIES: MaoC family dehydratase [unclassified Rhizobium]KJF74977.1 Nodulation protein N [Agrobacterium arsenijevicii]MDH7804008.1 acyl dehydratase [Rhizobium sp. AN70]